MKPFEPEIEAALLLILRSTQVWPCFVKSKRKIGRLGTRVQGYWESQGRPTIIKKSKWSSSLPSTSISESETGRNSFRVPSSPTEKVITAPEITFCQELAAKPTQKPITSSELEYLQSIWKTVKKIFGQQHTSRMPLWFLYFYRQTGFSTPAPVYNLSWKLAFSENSLFYTREFCLPASHEQKFARDKIVGKYLTDSVTLGVFDEDSGAKTIYQGSVSGRSLLDLLLTPVFCLQHRQQVLSTIFSENEIWMRTLNRRNDGSIAVLLSRVSSVLGCFTCSLTEFQDVTDQFLPHLQIEMDLAYTF